MFTVQPIDTIYGGGAEARTPPPPWHVWFSAKEPMWYRTPGCECDELPLHHHTPLA